jgi:hypothetical protein
MLTFICDRDRRFTQQSLLSVLFICVIKGTEAGDSRLCGFFHQSTSFGPLFHNLYYFRIRFCIGKCSNGMQHGNTACTCSMYMLHGHASWGSSWMQLVHAALTCTLDMQHGHAAWTCSRDMQVGHAAWTCMLDMQHGHEAWTCTCTCMYTDST